MKRVEAVTCLKEINAACRNMSPKWVALVNSLVDDETSTGVQVHIQTVLDGETKQQIQNITGKHRYKLREEKGKVVIYQPKAAM